MLKVMVSELKAALVSNEVQQWIYQFVPICIADYQILINFDLDIN
jgi:hypothetical protein